MAGAQVTISDVVVEIQARLDLLKESLAKAEKMVDDSVNRMNQKVRTFGSALSAAVTSVGGLVLGIKAATLGMNAMSAFARTFASDMETARKAQEEFVEAARKIPLVSVGHDASKAATGLLQALLPTDALRTLDKILSFKAGGIAPVSTLVPGGGFLGMLVSEALGGDMSVRDERLNRQRRIVKDNERDRKSFERDVLRSSVARDPVRQVQFEAEFEREDLDKRFRERRIALSRAFKADPANRGKTFAGSKQDQRLQEIRALGEFAIDERERLQLEDIRRGGTLTESRDTALGAFTFGAVRPGTGGAEDVDKEMRDILEQIRDILSMMQKGNGQGDPLQ